MFNTVAWELRGPRTTPLIAAAIINGLDLTGSTFHMQIRDRRDGGTLRATLGTVSVDGAEGVRIVSVDTTDPLKPVTVIGVRVNEDTMEGMPASPEPGEDYALWWGMHITAPDASKFLAFDAPFVLEASTPV